MRRYIWLTMLLLATGLSTVPGVSADIGREELFFRANEAYREGRFQEAIDGYLQLIRSGQAGGSVYYNLGNAYFKADQLGRAIQAYERALLLMPRDADLNFNLSHARDQTRDAVGDAHGSIETVFFWLRSFSFSEFFFCFGVLNLLFWSILSIRLFNRSESVYYLLLIAVSLWVVSGVSLGLKYWQVISDDRAVVLQKEADVLAGPHAADTTLFKLHEGTIVHHERCEDGWSLIHLSDTKRGWVRTGAVGQISGDPQTLGQGPTENTKED